MRQYRPKDASYQKTLIDSEIVVKVVVVIIITIAVRFSRQQVTIVDHHTPSCYSCWCIWFFFLLSVARESKNCSLSAELSCLSGIDTGLPGEIPTILRQHAPAGSHFQFT